MDSQRVHRHDFNLFGSRRADRRARHAPASTRGVGAKIAPYLKESGQRIPMPSAIDLCVHICFRAVEQYFRLFAEHFIVSARLIRGAAGGRGSRDTMLSAIALCVGEALAYRQIFSFLLSGPPSVLISLGGIRV